MLTTTNEQALQAAIQEKLSGFTVEEIKDPQQTYPDPSYFQTKVAETSTNKTEILLFAGSWKR